MNNSNPSLITKNVYFLFSFISFSIKLIIFFFVKSNLKLKSDSNEFKYFVGNIISSSSIAKFLVGSSVSLNLSVLVFFSKGA